MNSFPPPPFSVMLVDDEPSWLLSMEIALERSLGLTRLIKCQDSREVLPTLAERSVGVVLLDLIMPHRSGQELLEEVVKLHPEVAVIVITGLDQVETAVDCMKKGAFDYFVKSAEEERLINGVQRAIRMVELQRENARLSTRLLEEELSQPEHFDHIVTADPRMLAIFRYIEAIAPSPQPVLITGESGTGKELVAQAIHKAENRKGPWVPVNVAGLDDQVFTDTLFGHVKGAFTGAETPRSGVVEQSREGTLFLDEIGDLSPASQVKLLRLLQDGEYCPLGSEKRLRTNARMVIATNQDLRTKQAKGEFRTDLFYRLNAHHIDIPPLRERKGDIPLLLEHFLAEAAASMGKTKPTPPPELSRLLCTYHFPGNVRELRSMVYDAVSLHQGGVLSTASFHRALEEATHGEVEEQEKCASFGELLTRAERLPTFKEALDLLTTEALRRSEGNQTIAARLLGVTRPALSKRLKIRNQKNSS